MRTHPTPTTDTTTQANDGQWFYADGIFAYTLDPMSSSSGTAHTYLAEMDGTTWTAEMFRTDLVTYYLAVGSTQVPPTVRAQVHRLVGHDLDRVRAYGHR